MKVRGLALGLLAALVGLSYPTLASPISYQRPGRTSLVSISSGGSSANYAAKSFCSGGSWGLGDISADGRYATFAASATNMVPGVNTAPRCDLYWRDVVRGAVERVNIASDGTQELPDPLNQDLGYASGPSISADGRWVAFVASGANLVPGDTNHVADVFVHDTRTGATVRASLGAHGQQANGQSSQPSISADGRYVAFGSSATNLVPDDTNGAIDVFVRDLKLGTTRRMSLSSTGAQSSGNSGVYGVTISASGRYVAFGSVASNLVPGDTTSQACRCQAPDVFWHDTKTGRTLRVSVASSGAQASFGGFPSCVVSAAPLTSLPDPVGPVGGTQLTLCGSQIAWDGGHSISDDGRFVAFQSNATNLVPNDTNVPSYDGFVHDVLTHRTERVSVNSLAQEFPGGATSVRISGDGRYVTYNVHQQAKDCRTSVEGVDLPVNMPVSCVHEDASLYDRSTGSLERLALTPNAAPAKAGQCDLTFAPSNFSDGFGVSRGGRYVLFTSSTTNLAPGDGNQHCDYFVRDRGPALGVGGFTAAQPPTTTEQTCVADILCVPPIPGAQLTAARVVPRSGDLMVRWDLKRLAPLAGVPSGGVLYAMSFSANGQHYQMRAERAPGPDYDVAGGASFGLFRESLPGVWTRVASLKGGYGTVGDSVVAAVPLSLLGGSAQLRDVTAYTAVGSYLTGATKVLDSLRLS